MLSQVSSESIDKSGLVVHELFSLMYNDASPPREDRGLLNDIYPGIDLLRISQLCPVHELQSSQTTFLVTVMMSLTQVHLSIKVDT